jgi:WD40 repeat protein
MKTNRQLLIGSSFLMLIFAVVAPSAAGDAELILFNGKIITVDPQDDIYQAVAVKNGKILQLGTDAEIKALAAARCKMIDLGGKIMFDEGKNPVVTLSDRWVAAGPMLHARQNHTATLLKNGKVLIVGWDTSQAELYDPSTDTFIVTDSTKQVHRQGLTATLLNDGRVLIVGGNNAQKTAEIYDPATEQFSLTGNLTIEHSYHTATLLSNGCVLIAGGQNENGPQTHAAAEIYDPTTGAFTLTGSLNEHRSIHTATLLQDGQVLITGGIQTTTPGYGIVLNSCELYNPADGTFKLIQSLDQSRQGHAATLLNDGRVLISCGSWYQCNGELYDPTTGTWSLTGEMTVMRRNYQTATLLQDGKVLLAGGYIAASTSSAEIYDPTTNTFSAVDSMITPRMEHAAVCLPDGSVLVTGGYSSNDAVNLAERYLVGASTAVHSKPVQKEQETPESFQLSQNFPNPFNPITYLKYTLASSGNVRISVFNLRGELIKMLVDAEKSAGEYRVSWDGRNSEGNQMGTGVYLVRMDSGGRATCRKVIFIK